MPTPPLRRIGTLFACLALVALTTAPAPAADAGRWWYTDLSVAKANRVSTGAGVTVAVLDTGIKASLPDLAGRVLPGTTFYGPRGDGRTDLPTRKASYYGHGTAMAAFIAGTGRGAGIRGVAPGAKLLPVRVGPTEGSTNEAIQQGIRWATDHGATVISMSVAGPAACTPAMQDAVDYAVRKDVILVAGTGNTPGVPVESPANCIGTLGIGGTAKSALQPWSGGTTGPELDFVAPAENISTLLLDDTVSNADADGTSIATALAAGTFALLRSKYPDESARQIVTRALYNVANGLGGKVFAQRIDDRLGYGEILPAFALTNAPPPDAKNPIYDAIEQHLAAADASASASPSAGSLSSTPSPAVAGNGSDGLAPRQVGTFVVVGVVLVAAALAGVVLVVARSRRPKPR